MAGLRILWLTYFWLDSSFVDFWDNHYFILADYNPRFILIYKRSFQRFVSHRHHQTAKGREKREGKTPPSVRVHLNIRKLLITCTCSLYSLQLALDLVQLFILFSTKQLLELCKCWCISWKDRRGRDGWFICGI